MVADHRADRRDGVHRCDDLEGLGILALGDQPHVGLHIRMRRAGGTAGGLGSCFLDLGAVGPVFGRNTGRFCCHMNS